MATVPSSQQIAPGVFGWLEGPDPAQPLSDCVLVRGWVFADGVGIESVTIEMNGVKAPARYGLRRDDVLAAYPTHAGALDCGFMAYLVDAHGGRTFNRLEVWARRTDGRTLRLFHRHREGLSPARFAFLRQASSALARRPYLLLSGTMWRRAFERLRMKPSGAPLAETMAPQVDGRPTEALRGVANVALRSFLAADVKLRFDRPETALVSVVIVVWNQAALSLSCLRALAAQTFAPLEIIVVDNASTDDTARLLDRVDGIVVVRPPENLGFTVAANRGAAAARGKYLLFLNNDADLLPGAVAALVRTCEEDDAAGAVGGKLVFPDGRMQEAGSTIWADGSCSAYGRGDDPASFEYGFTRDVDFCSGALLLTPRVLFEQLRGFDECYRPAYYEDVDYCVRVWKSGKRVVFQPAAVALHLEFGSSSRADAILLHQERRETFVTRHRDWLSGQLGRSVGQWSARHHPHQRRRALLIDDDLPRPALGAGFPRAAALLRALRALGYAVSHYPIADGAWPRDSRGGFEDVEVVSGGVAGLRGYLRSARRFDAVIVSRPHNMQHVKAALGSGLDDAPGPVIYDAEAVFALRDAARARLLGASSVGHEDDVNREVELGRGCAAILTVTEMDRRLFETAGFTNVVVLGHAIDLVGNVEGPHGRDSVLFVGAFGPGSPNEDSARYLVTAILPVLRARPGLADVRIVVAGSGLPERLTLLDASVSWHSDVDDLTPLYAGARVFVAPTRFSAGIPLKVIEAAAHGVPVVCTPPLVAQLGWIAGEDIEAAESPDEFADRIGELFADAERWSERRAAGLRRVHAEHSPSGFCDRLQILLGQVSGKKA